jgi:hypothetical protein
MLGLYWWNHGKGTPTEGHYRKLIVDAHILELLGEGCETGWTYAQQSSSRHAGPE